MYVRTERMNSLVYNLAILFLSTLQTQTLNLIWLRLDGLFEYFWMNLCLIGYVQLTGDESEFASVSFSFFLCVTVEVEVEVMSCHSVVSIIFLRKILRKILWKTLGKRDRDHADPSYHISLHGTILNKLN